MLLPFGFGMLPGVEVLGLGAMPAPLVEEPVPIELLGDPGPLTVRRSVTRRLAAYDCATRIAVVRSLALGTVPLKSIDVSVTLTITPDKPCCCRAVWI